MRTALWMVLIALPQIAVSQLAWGANSADDVAKQYAAAMANEDFGGALSLVRPKDLQELGGTLRDVITNPTFGESVRSELGTFKKDPKSMSDAEILGQVFTAAYIKFREMGAIGPSKLKIAMLGSVNEDVKTVHFVQKAEVTDTPNRPSQVSLVSVILEGDKWYVEFPEALRAQARSFADQLRETAEHAEMDLRR